MTLRNLPEIQAARLPEAFAFEADSDAIDRWNAGIQAAAAPENTITILDVIGEDPWTGGGVTSKRVASALRAIGDRDVFVDINSPGGDFFEGVAIYNMLRAHPAKVTVRILGLAASAASVIAMAGDEIQIGKAGFMMIHNAWVVAVGNRHDLDEASKTLATFDDAMAGLYADRADVDRKATAKWMDDETWFNGEQAVSNGLADDFLASDAVSTAQASAKDPVNAIRKVDALMAKQGIPRNERRSLIGGIKGGKQDAAPTVTHDAGDWNAAAEQLLQTLRS